MKRYAIRTKSSAGLFARVIAARISDTVREYRAANPRTGHWLFSLICSYR